MCFTLTKNMSDCTLSYHTAPHLFFCFSSLQDSVNRANRTLRQVDNDITPTLISEYAREWTNSGASVLGGCCGVGPEHIHALRMYCSASHDVEKSFPASTSTVSTSS
jgi:S-methylmethionine-dependent homocysteine/selenocysteine methylase